MSIPTLLAIFALVLAVIAQVQARGYDLVCWAVILISIAMLWGVFVT